MIDVRLRTKISEEELTGKVGRILSDDDYNLLLTRATTVRKPDGKPLCIYLPNEIDPDLLDRSYPTLHSLKGNQSYNRGLASGMRRSKVTKRGTRTMTTHPIASAIIGGFDPKGPRQYCRLTAWTGREFDAYQDLFPLFEEISRAFERHVPDRYKAQADLARETHPDWVIAGTPFTTVTVNNTYATGVHTDKGDLPQGFSNLLVLRRGQYTGGNLVFPEYRVGVEMRHGDLLLMDAHEFHGNTALQLRSPDAERISIVAYYRTQMTRCEAFDKEAEKAKAYYERRNASEMNKTDEALEEAEIVAEIEREKAEAVTHAG